jgi:hypothetical protein
MMSSPEWQMPDYWMPQPPMKLDVQTRSACDELLAAAIAQGPEQPPDYTLAIPKWQLL